MLFSFGHNTFTFSSFIFFGNRKFILLLIKISLVMDNFKYFKNKHIFPNKINRYKIISLYLKLILTLFNMLSHHNFKSIDI